MSPRIALGAGALALAVLAHEALLRYCLDGEVAAGLLAGRIADPRALLVVLLLALRLALFVALPPLVAGLLIHRACLPRSRPASPPP